MGINAAISTAFGLAILKSVVKLKMRHAKETMAKLKAVHSI